MPLFDFTCTTCNHTFEELCITAEDVPACPACQGKDVERGLSLFAAHTEAAPACGLPVSSKGDCGMAPGGLIRGPQSRRITGQGSTVH